MKKIKKELSKRHSPVNTDRTDIRYDIVNATQIKIKSRRRRRRRPKHKKSQVAPEKDEDENNLIQS